MHGMNLAGRKPVHQLVKLFLLVHEFAGHGPLFA
jgi:hypothetical protein